MPTAPFTALERRRSEFLFQTAVVLSAAEGPASFWYHSSHVLDHGEAWEQEAMYMLVNAAAEPLMRRLVHVRGELRFSFARLASLFGGDAGEPAATDVVANAFRATRFRIEDLPRLLAGLRIPETFIAGGHRFLGEEGLLIMLVRLAFPGRNSVLAAEAGRWPSETSSCFNFLMQFIYDEFACLRDWRSLALWVDYFPRFADAVHARGCPLRNIFGFIDGKLQHVSRPGRYQGVLYSGNDRVHGFKWQGIMLPNGIMPFPFGPICGSNHDAEMLRRSQLFEALEFIMQHADRVYALFGDLAYPNHRYMHRPFEGAVAGSWQDHFNQAMSSVRIAVEWGFGKIMANFQYLNHEENLKVLHQPVGIYFPVANILTNCHTCLYGSITGDYFDLEPPSLEDYLSGARLTPP